MKGKTRTIAKFLRTALIICSYSRDGKTPSYSRINTVGAVSPVILLMKSCLYSSLNVDY